MLLLTPEAYLPLRGVSAQFHASNEGTAAAGRVFEILDTPAERPPLRPSGPGRSSSPGGDLRTDASTLNGVTVVYPDRVRPAVDGVSLTIRPGERIILTGPSGAGKSSLLALLLRFIQPTAGTIEVGGADLASIPAGPWRAQIAWVPQHPYLFAASVADNIALGRPAASADAIRQAAQLAGAAEFIEALPGGYQTTLGARALRLSAGQRQKIALARAFLIDAPLLLMDEPAAHLDPASARQIGQAIDVAMASRTVIMVTHSQGWTGGSGRVLVLNRGRLAAAPGLAGQPAGAVLR